MLAGDIYLRGPIFVLPHHASLNERERYMTGKQETIRKDIEQFVGFLQPIFKINRQERHEWSDRQLILVSQACVILHNMIAKMSVSAELFDEVDATGVAQSNRVLLELFFTCEADLTTDEGDIEQGSGGGIRELPHLTEQDVRD